MRHFYRMIIWIPNRDKWLYEINLKLLQREKSTFAKHISVYYVPKFKHIKVAISRLLNSFSQLTNCKKIIRQYIYCAVLDRILGLADILSKFWSLISKFADFLYLADTSKKVKREWKKWNSIAQCSFRISQRQYNVPCLD